jgi:gluconolactonase
MANRGTGMTLSILDDRIRAIVGDDAEIEQVATGFKFTEGPAWDPRTSSLIFSDIPGDIMRRWSAANGIQTFRQPSNKANGNTWDLQGRLISCEHASRLTRTEDDGSVTVLATHYQGRELNSPNDVVVKSDGSIYFSDPTYGRMEGFGFPREQDLDYQGVYRFSPDSGELTLLADDFGQPNGLTFSVDESKLFVNDTDRGHIRMFDTNADGSVSGGGVWVEVTGDGAGALDGMKVDSQDNLYTTGPGGIHVFSMDGTDLGVIGLPEGPANFTWGDEDLRTLYVTATTSLYRTRVKVPGRTLI